LTPDELAKVIADKASARLRDPQVIVTMNQPGPVQIQEGMTPMQAIFDRGGFRDTAQKDAVVLIRDAGSENPQIGRINLFGSLENGPPDVLRHGLYLDKAAFKRNFDN
jgi:protein involved in polysaccharide export with SLBB domain